MPDFSTSKKILERSALLLLRQELSNQGQKVVFTNGCFDLFHAGHAATFAFAKSQGDVLVVGINSDDSMKRLKGPKRPMIHQNHRATMIAALAAVDYVVIFDETEVLPLIEEIKPDVLVKGQDREGDVVGQEFVEGYGGRVAMAPLVEGLSTTELIKKVLDTYSP
jgi:D-beta-D-heptose 7-phosphate kinase/D-beta-D-heptose 1-phosphate adenosyltransferase